jgi:hypothetical protein
MKHTMIACHDAVNSFPKCGEGGPCRADGQVFHHPEQSYIVRVTHCKTRSFFYFGFSSFFPYDLDQDIVVGTRTAPGNQLLVDSLDP